MESFHDIAEGVVPKNLGHWGCAALLKTLTIYFRPKYAIFPALFQTWPNLQDPIFRPDPYAILFA